MDSYQLFGVQNPPNASQFQEIYMVMEKAFPKEERRDAAGQKTVLDNPSYRLLARENDGRITAFFAYWELKDFWFGEHFAVEESLRGQGIGGVMLDRLCRACPMDFILEVEPPETEIAGRRIRFYEKHGFHLNPYPYEQPALQAGTEPIPLLIMSHSHPLSPRRFEAVRAELYKKVYQLKD